MDQGGQGSGGGSQPATASLGKIRRAKNKLIWTREADFDYRLQVNMRFYHRCNAPVDFPTEHTPAFRRAMRADRVWQELLKEEQNMKAITSRSWALALNLLILWPLAGGITAEEIGDQREVVAPATDSDISMSEVVDDPAAGEPQEPAAEELDEPSAEGPMTDESSAEEPSAMEPAVLPSQTETDSSEAAGDDLSVENSERVITPLPAGGDERSRRGLHAAVRLMPAKRKIPMAAITYHEIQPGTSTKADVVKAWGAPLEVRKLHGVVTYTFRLKDASRLTATMVKNVVSTIVVQTERPSPPEELASALGVDGVSSVQVADEDGKILGEAFPERGLLFGYAPDSSPARVSQIILEALESQPFLLRAEAELETDYPQCLADANAALELDPQSAAAQAMRARVYRQAGDLNAALQAAEAALAIEPGEAEWNLLLAKILVQLSDFTRAKLHIQEVLDNKSSDVLARAGRHLLLGDTLALSSSQGFAAAIKHHQEAVRLAKTLIDDPRARRRLKACELLIDAHLHVAYSIGWGYFQHKSQAVQKWLDGAAALAEDLVRKDVLRPDVELRVNEQALAALAGLADPPDVSKWENAAIAQAKALFDETDDPIRASQIQWQLGLALCDAVQIEQTRHNYDRALALGQLASEHLKQADSAGRQLPNHDFLLGQLFYRLGVIHAVGRKDHGQAVEWYAQAVKLLETPVPASHTTDPGRHGETFVSIAVSYWEIGEREEAMRLTQQGVKLMEQAAEEGLLNKAALAVPYSNLASMYTELGDPRRATQFSTMAAKLQREKQ